MSSSEDNVVELAGPDVKPKAPFTGEEEFGVPSTLPTGSWSSFIAGVGQNEAENRNILTLDQLIEMRRKDGQARALQRLVTLPIRKAASEAEWIEPEEGGAAQETDFANKMWTLPPYQGGMTVPWNKLIRQVCLAIFEGFAAFEEVRYVPEKGPLKGKVVLKKMSHRDGRTIRFLVDKKGGYDGIRQVTTALGEAIDVKIPKEKTWYFASNEEENPFYGVSYFEAAYFHHEVKKRLYYISHLAAQFAAVPARVGKLPQTQVDPNRLQAFKTALANFAFNTSMTVPFGFEVELMNSGSNFDFLALIDHHNSQMSKSVLAKFLDDEQRQVLIENATQDASADLFLMTIESIITEIEESLSMYVMPKYIDWNFGTQKYPKLKFGALSDSNRDAIKELFTVIATAQTTMWTKEFIRELEKKLTDRYGLEVDYDAVEKREEEEAAEMEEQKRREAQLFEQQFGSQPQPGGPPGGGPGGEESGF